MKKAPAGSSRGLCVAVDMLCHTADKQLILNDECCISGSARAVDNVVEDGKLWSTGGANAAEIG
jgi:hypothetical protein